MNKNFKFFTIILAAMLIFAGCDQTQTEENTESILGDYKSNLIDLDISISDYTTFYENGDFTIYTNSQTINDNINEEIYFNIINNGEKFANNIEFGLAGILVTDENIIVSDSKKTIGELRIGEEYQEEVYFKIDQINSDFSRKIELEHYHFYDYETRLNSIVCLEDPYKRNEFQECDPRNSMEFEYSSGPLGFTSVLQSVIRANDDNFIFTFKMSIDNSLGGKFAVGSPSVDDFKTDSSTGRFQNQILMDINTPISGTNLECIDGTRTTVEEHSNGYLINFYNTEISPIIRCELTVPANKLIGNSYFNADFSYVFYNENSLNIQHEFEDFELI